MVVAGLLTRAGRPPSDLLLYAWHPLPVWEIACDGHGDAAFLAVAFDLSARRRRRVNEPKPGLKA